ncbi:hypothetical protein [Pseudomonas xanthosomatis]|uniref:hypothetical protein n=1 Tax=Pseudomonas xanthosomatis TaxID=2842356 RepID=UPI003514704D
MPKPPDILTPDHPLYIEAIEALRRYHEAVNTHAPAIEVERLRLIAESLFQTVTDYQMRAFGASGGTTH